MHRKGLGPSNLSGLEENPDYTCPDYAELPVVQTFNFCASRPDVCQCLFVQTTMGNNSKK